MNPAGAAWQPTSVRQDVRADGGFAYAVIGADLNVFADRGPTYLLRARRPAAAVPPEWLLAQPSRLLNAHHAVVGFTGRDAELAALTDWRESGPRLAARWLHAPGGQGKTRLADEFARRSAAAGWKVVDAVPGVGTILPAASQEDLRLGDAAGVLLVVDYADRWPRSDLTWLFSNALVQHAVPTRLLLVARSVVPWLSVRAALDRLQAGTSEQALRPLADDRGERERMYAAAWTSFAARYGTAQDAGSLPAGLLDKPEYGLTLAIHLAALVSVDAMVHRRPYPDSVLGLSAYLLDREREHWEKLHTSGTDFQTPPRVMGRAVFVAALTGSLPHRDGSAVLRRVDLETHPDRVLGDHAVCYPPADASEGGVLEPLYPDRLAEDFLALSLPGHALDGHPADPWASSALPEIVTGDVPYLSRAITFLAAAAGRWPSVGERHLYPLLLANPGHAVAAGGAALAGLAELPSIPVPLLEAIEAELPDTRDVDLDVGIAAVAAALAAHRLAGDPDPARRVGVQWELSILLSNAGRDREALEAAQQAVALARHLVAGDRAAFEPDLADSLATLGGALSTLGQWADGLGATTEAVELHRRLAARDPGTFGQALARGLHNLSIALAAAGAREEAVEAAEEAVAMRRRTDLPDNADHLAGALDNLRVRLIEVGRFDGALGLAEEAVAAHRDMVAANPAAFGPDLARVLSNHSVLLTKVGRHAEAVAAAEEAVAMGRGLARANKTAFEVDLATSLTNLGNALSELGERARACEATSEAVELYRELARGNAGLVANLALALSNLGKHLADVGRLEEALDATDEAVETRRQLAAENPAAHRPGLATSLDALGKRLYAAGLLREGLDASSESVEIRRGLVADHPGAFDADLATSLTNDGTLRWGLGRREEALAVTAEAIEVRRRVVTRGVDAPELAAALANFSAMLAGAGRLEEALAAATEAVALYRQQSTSYPAVAAPGLSASLANLGLVLAFVGRQTEALAATQEAVAIRRVLAAENPMAFEPELAASLTNLVADLLALNRLAEGLATAEEAVSSYRRLTGTSPGRFAGGLATALTNLCIALFAAGRAKDAHRAGTESVEIFEALARVSPGVFEADLARARGLVKDLRRKRR
ncbi:tetratricopeptide repeat protein [Asanoa ferruginea]|uniref:Tetratricopeptide repeat protein n=1 Tax=Asanoa ferruginea TaxID=53367 RepID=A0A3D9ZL33_9ACTN|nr:tetratricopeptide repeat protein [Asanoa ferruginea]REF94370.1 tetratricopeptide repeat protein [Asanoa ferruginea]GIF51114.1 hypothetical protein Afe04nite_56530 [Asanoa ferruginea]